MTMQSDIYDLNAMGIKQMQSNVTVTGLKELNSYIGSLHTKGTAILKRVISQTARDAEKTYKSNLRQAGNYKKGDLESSIYKDIKSGGLSAEVGSDSGISRLIEYGSRPHKIRVKNAPVLTDGVDFFGKEVNHPGYKGNPALTRTYFKIVGLNGKKIVNRLKIEFSRVN